MSSPGEHRRRARGTGRTLKPVKYKRKYLEKSKSTTYQLAGPGGESGLRLK